MFTDNIEVKITKKLFKNCLEIKDVMLDSDLGLTALQLGSLLVYKDETVGSLLTRSFTALVANSTLDPDYCVKAAKAVGYASKVLSQDAVITTIYALTNLLFIDLEGGNGNQLRRKNTHLSRIDTNLTHRPKSAQSNTLNRTMTATSHLGGGGNSEEDFEAVCENAINSIVEISQGCDDQTVATLAVTILSQKTGSLDSSIGHLLLKGLVDCAKFLPQKEFVILIKLLNKLTLDALTDRNPTLLRRLVDALISLSRNFNESHPLFNVYLKELCLAIISRGDVQQLEHHRSHVEINEVGEQISIYLRPLAELLPNVYAGEKPLKITDTTIINLYRNIWFNMVVHGYSINTEIARIHSKDLERIAYNSPPLASELSWDRTETSLELNTVLRRGSSNHNVKDHKHIVGDIFEVHRTMSYPKLMFLSATVLVETLRVRSGDCSTILLYYSDPSIKTSGVDKYIGPIAFKIVKDFIHLIDTGANKQFSSENVANQLTILLSLCAYRVEELQDAALQCCDLLINRVPSSLVHRSSLYTLFDLLTVLCESVVDADVNQYDPTTSYCTKTTGIQLSLSDSYKWRTETFTRFDAKAKYWLKLILLKSNVDVKSLIQGYVTDVEKLKEQSVQYGVSVAIGMAGSVLPNDREFSNISKIPVATLNTLPTFVSALSWRSHFITELMNNTPLYSPQDSYFALKNIRTKVKTILSSVENDDPINNQEVVKLLGELAGLVIVSETDTAELVRYLVQLPFKIFEPSIVNTAIGIWFTVMQDRPMISMLIISEVAQNWEYSIFTKQGIFSTKLDIENPEFCKMEYAPSKKNDIAAKTAISYFEPHLEVIKLFSSSFQSTLNQSDHLLKIFTRFVEIGLKNLRYASLHPYARGVRFELIRFAFDILSYHLKLGSRSVVGLTELILDASLTWFRQRSGFPYGSNLLKIKADFSLLKEIAKLVGSVHTFKLERLESKKIILMFFLDDEISKISVWLTPTNPVETRGSFMTNQITGNHITKSYALDPILAVNLALRYKIKNLDEILQSLVAKNPIPAVHYPDAVQFFIGINAAKSKATYHLLYWAPLAPIDAITLFLPPFGKDAYTLQYTMRSLEHHDVNLTFFYVPQIVQSLRHDALGYVERFILETAQVSQLFAHQIVWNMLANSYKDEDSTEPDAIKPILDRIQDEMTASFSKKDLAYYQLEFGFFNEVTDISGKLKPYIKKSKAEKKLKIDEEMAKIDVKPGVYLPSNPDGVVVDINRKSGRPLQSHAKAPFMATFKIKKEITEYDEKGNEVKFPIEKWQSAIFKVGDDCRQDVLALQLISVFRTIWANAGLELYVNPYRVTATAPGCGVIDVLPNSTSRDMLGREAVNGLYEYYITKFGPENSLEFQQARNNLIKSLAAYSIISFLLQFKDRHNGNIMYDGEGHVLHIDFGFCFDIVPGGVKFEAVPFKLTHEMIMVLGGRADTQAFKWFEELCIKGYLACRPYMETIVRCVQPMLESGLPCFKETTIKKLRQRFVPGKSEKEASAYFQSLIKKSLESFFTKGYDEFQRLTNGIPY
jgi:phosphatidylinositol 4-kinase